MSNVTLVIAGREYAVACDSGEEAHVRKLGQLIDEKLQTMPGGVATSETRSLLFATLLLADELHELRGAPQIVAPAPAASNAPALDAIATRLEKLAISLEAEALSA